MEGLIHSPCKHVESASTVRSDHLYCIFCPPLFSIFFCLLLSPPTCSSAPPLKPAEPCLRPLTALKAAYTAYSGTAMYNHQARSPKMIVEPRQIHVQYKTSHIYSVKPFASRSCPARTSDPFSAKVGRPSRSRKNSRTSAGVLNRK